MTTIFERIIAGELPCAKVYEDELIFAFMDAGQFARDDALENGRHGDPPQTGNCITI